MPEKDMAQKIRELRIAREMTLEQVANIVGVGKSTVRKWETGMIANMRRDKIALLASALGTTPEYLMGWEKKTQDEYSAEFRDRLAISLQVMRDNLVGDEDGIGDYYELRALTESTYPLSLAEACIAAEKIGESVSYLLGEDTDNQEEAPDADESAPRDEQDKQIMNLVKQMTVPQKNLLLALLRTAVLQNQGMPVSDLASIGGAIPKSEHQGLA